MVTKIRQTDPRWASERLGPSNATVRAYGCTTCAMCMSLEKLRGYFCNPGDAARHWTYNSQGLILWYQTEWKGMSFVKRGHIPNKGEVAEYANGEETAAIMEVNNGAHWVYVDRVEDGKFKIIDPIDGNYYESLPIKYKFTGYALFKKEEIVSDWAKEAWEKATNKGIMDGTRPQDKVTREELAVVLDRLELLN